MRATVRRRAGVGACLAVLVAGGDVAVIEAEAAGAAATGDAGAELGPAPCDAVLLQPTSTVASTTDRAATRAVRAASAAAGVIAAPDGGALQRSAV